MFLPTLAFLLTTGLGIVFLASAIPKLRRPKSFVLVVLEYQVLPERLASVVGRILPPAELGLACLLLVGVLPEIASAVTGMLLISFVVGIGVNLARGRRIACGCFGSQRTIGWPLLLQDVALLGASALAIALSHREGMVASWSAIRVFDSPTWLPILSSVACACVPGMVALQILAQRTPAFAGGHTAANVLPPYVRPTGQRPRRSS